MGIIRDVAQRKERGNGISLVYKPSYAIHDLDLWGEGRFDPNPYFPSPYGFADFQHTDFFHRLRNLPVDHSHVVLDSYRPDLVSWREFGTTKLWWLILAYNGLSVSDLKRGVKLSIPSMGDLESLLYDLAQETVLRQQAEESV